MNNILLIFVHFLLELEKPIHFIKKYFHKVEWTL